MRTIRFVWWNLENFFDTDDDPISEDFEYTEAHGWTDEVFKAKKANLAQALNATHGGSGPELLAVAEIENDELLKELIKEMGNPHLKVVEDPKVGEDYRGIDVAVAYDEQKLSVTSQVSHIVHLRYRTRDILEVKFKVKETGETLVVFASHWPSRKPGTYLTEPLRIAVAEHIAYLVEDHVKVSPEEYKKLRDDNDLAPVLKKWETKVMVVGDFNDGPGGRSVVDHLRASNNLDRVVGKTNDIDGFEDETAEYRKQDVFLYNTTWRFLSQHNVGTYFFSGGTREPANRYQVFDQLVVSRGLLTGDGLALDLKSVDIFRGQEVATKAPYYRPREFGRKTKKGTSDHLPLTAVLEY